MSSPSSPIQVKSDWIRLPDGASLFSKTWSPPDGVPPRAVLVFVHGFVEFIERYDDVFPRFAERGYEVFAFDQRGFGKSAASPPDYTKFTSDRGKTSWPEALADIEHFVKEKKSERPDVPLFLYGHSMGGALVLAFVTRSSHSHYSPTIPSQDSVSLLTGVVSSAPWIRLSEPPLPIVKWAGVLFAKLFPHMPFTAHIDAKAVSRIPEVREEFRNNPLCKGLVTFGCLANSLDGGLRLVTEDYVNYPATLPLLLYHGADDGVTSQPASEEFFGKITADDKIYRTYEGGYHELHNDLCKREMLSDVIDWLDKHTSPAPSAASDLETHPMTAAPAESSAAASEPDSSVKPADAPEGGDSEALKPHM